MYAKNIRVENGKYIFDITGKLFDLNDVVLNMGGEHNIENATAAAIAAFKAGVKLEDIKKAINCFKGVKRRFEFVLKQKNKVLIDDYAHHPQELSALIQGVKHLYPNKKMLVVFQPHLYSRTRDFASGFAKSLSNADEVILLPIYPARELPMPGVESEMIAKNITVPNSVVSKQELMHIIAEKEIDVLVMAGAGDIDALVEPVKNILSNK
jgi:UDP-N-acetylmuramate--alanine ligase